MTSDQLVISVPYALLNNRNFSYPNKRVKGLYWYFHFSDISPVNLNYRKEQFIECLSDYPSVCELIVSAFYNNPSLNSEQNLNCYFQCLVRLSETKRFNYFNEVNHLFTKAIPVSRWDKTSIVRQMELHGKTTQKICTNLTVSQVPTTKEANFLFVNIFKEQEFTNIFNKVTKAVTKVLSIRSHMKFIYEVNSGDQVIECNNSLESSSKYSGEEILYLGNCNIKAEHALTLVKDIQCLPSKGMLVDGQELNSSLVVIVTYKSFEQVFSGNTSEEKMLMCNWITPESLEGITEEHVQRRNKLSKQIILAILESRGIATIELAKEIYDSIDSVTKPKDIVNFRTGWKSTFIDGRKGHNNLKLNLMKVEETEEYKIL